MNDRLARLRERRAQQRAFVCDPLPKTPETPITQAAVVVEGECAPDAWVSGVSGVFGTGGREKTNQAGAAVGEVSEAPGPPPEPAAPEPAADNLQVRAAEWARKAELATADPRTWDVATREDGEALPEVEQDADPVRGTADLAGLEAVGALGVPPSWATGIERLKSMGRPARVTPEQWGAMREHVLAFVQAGWPGRAYALGWDVWTVFGCHRLAPVQRGDMRGVALPVLPGARVVDVTGEAAIIETVTGSRLTKPRRLIASGSPEQVLVWELQETGQ